MQKKNDGKKKAERAMEMTQETIQGFYLFR